MRRSFAPLVALVLAAVTAGVVVALNYEGEDYCRDYPAWPNGTYLGQMHPHHSNFYAGYAERRGWDPCVTWALDQRGSAVRGLRELGFQVVEPSGGAPALTPTPTPDPAPVPPTAPKLTGPATTTWVHETFVNNQVTGEKSQLAIVRQGGKELATRCQDNEIEVFVWFGSRAYITGNLDDLVRTDWRFNEDSALSGGWYESLQNESVFSPSAVETAKQLIQANRFRIQATAWHDGEKFFADFSLNGSSDPNHPIRRVFKACGYEFDILGELIGGGQDYAGDEFCKNVVAWPNGSYLGQMHPHHSKLLCGIRRTPWLGSVCDLGIGSAKVSD